MENKELLEQFRIWMRKRLSDMGKLGAKRRMENSTAEQRSDWAIKGYQEMKKRQKLAKSKKQSVYNSANSHIKPQ